MLDPETDTLNADRFNDLLAQAGYQPFHKVVHGWLYRMKDGRRFSVRPNTSTLASGVLPGFPAMPRVRGLELFNYAPNAGRWTSVSPYKELAAPSPSARFNITTLDAAQAVIAWLDDPADLDHDQVVYAPLSETERVDAQPKPPVTPRAPDPCPSCDQVPSSRQAIRERICDHCGDDLPRSRR